MATLRSVVIPLVLAVSLISSVGTIFTAWAQTPQHIWSQRFGDAGQQSGNSVAVDGSGNFIVTGTFQDTVDFGGGPLTSAGSYDIFVAKFDGGGNHIWSQRFGDADGQNGERVAVDGSGNVIVTGDFRGTVDFGGGPLTSSAGYWDIFIAKFDATGNHIWSQRFGNGLAQYGLWVPGVAVDGSGNVIVTDSFQGTVDFGGGPLTSAGSYDIFVAKFDGGGNHIWSQRFGDAGQQSGNSVAVDGSGNVIVAGPFADTVDFGGGPLTSAGSWDIFVAKFDATGNHIFSQRFGDGSDQWGWGKIVAVDGSGNVIVTGSFQGTVDFGGGPLVSVSIGDIFVAKFDAGGNHIWSQDFNNAHTGTGHRSPIARVAVDGSGNVILTGNFTGTLHLGGGPLVCPGYQDIFVAKFGGGGNHIFSQRFGDWYGQSGNSVAVDGSGNVIVTGSFAGSVHFGGVPLVCAGELDIFVARFGADPSPTLLQSFSTTVRERGIDISWNLVEAGEDMRFHVLRAQAAITHFQEIQNANIVQEDLTFTFVDKSYKPGLTYRYRVDVSDEDGRRILFETDAITTPARELALDQNHPNPFNPTTTISFVLPEKLHVNLSIFNVDGQLITTLVDNTLSDGLNEATWDGNDANGNRVSSGVYLYRLKAGKKTITKKMVLLK